MWMLSAGQYSRLLPVQGSYLASEENITRGPNHHPLHFKRFTTLFVFKPISFFKEEAANGDVSQPVCRDILISNTFLYT
jgi:hypothetical protein